MFAYYFAHAAILTTWPDVTQVFGTIQLDPHSSINRHNNFRTFPQSLMLLFRYTSISLENSTELELSVIFDGLHCYLFWRFRRKFSQLQMSVVYVW